MDPSYASEGELKVVHNYINKEGYNRGTETVNCPIDNETSTCLFWKDGFPHYLCNTCGLRFVWPLPDSASALAFYGEGYRPDPSEPAYQAEGRAYAQTCREKFFHDLPNGCYTRNLTLLDIGCGFGFFLEAVRADFRRTYGLEVSWNQRAFASETLGLHILEGDGSSIPLEDESVDIVNISHVIEHLTQPILGLREILRVLAPGGLLVAATPNPQSLTACLLRRRWIYYKPSEHLFLFPPRCLVDLLAREGFEVVKVGTDSLLIHHILHAWRSPETERTAMRHSNSLLSKAIRGRRLLKVAKNATNALLKHFHVGDELRVTARKPP